MKKPLIYAGIDPGKFGAIAFLSEAGEPAYVPLTAPNDYGVEEEVCHTPYALKLPKTVSEIAALAGELLRYPNIVFVLEDPHAFPGFSIKTYKPLFEQLGVLKALFPTAILVPPRTWQAAVWSDEAKAMPKGTSPKARSLATAQSIKSWKYLTFRQDNAPGKPHDGVVDAMLIARYGVLTQGGQRQ